MCQYILSGEMKRGGLLTEGRYVLYGIEEVRAVLTDYGFLEGLCFGPRQDDVRHDISSDCFCDGSSGSLRDRWFI